MSRKIDPKDREEIMEAERALEFSTLLLKRRTFLTVTLLSIAGSYSGAGLLAGSSCSKACREHL